MKGLLWQELYLKYRGRAYPSDALYYPVSPITLTDYIFQVIALTDIFQSAAVANDLEVLCKCEEYNLMVSCVIASVCMIKWALEGGGAKEEDIVVVAIAVRYTLRR